MLQWPHCFDNGTESAETAVLFFQAAVAVCRAQIGFTLICQLRRLIISSCRQLNVSILRLLVK